MVKFEQVCFYKLETDHVVINLRVAVMMLSWEQYL